MAEDYTQNVLSASFSNEIQDYLMAHYDIHYNVLTGLSEYRPQGSSASYIVIGKRAENSIVLELQDHGLDCTAADVRRFLLSDRIPDYHPMMAFMDALPEWDGQDRVTPLAHRISQDLTWTNGFHRWLLGMAAQFMGQSQRCANALVPILVSREQGMNKSSFCRLLLPPELQFYYTDSLDVTSSRHVEQRLGIMALINLDEFDQIAEGKMAKLKNVLQMKMCQYRRLYSNQFIQLPRMASFIGTSNSNQLLWDPTGSRRFLCVTVVRPIDCSPIDHGQIFAQLKAELERGERPYLTHDEELEVEEHNQFFYHLRPEADVFNRCFRLPTEGEPAQQLTATDIFTRLQHHFPAALRQSNPQRFGHTLLQLGVPRIHTREGNFYSVVPL